MRVVALALVLLALGSSVAPAEAQSSWRIDATLVVASTTSADFQYSVVGLRNTVLTLYPPDGGTFTTARDLDGKLLDATPEGDRVRVSIQDRGAVLHFTIVAERGPPFVVFPAQLNGQGLSTLSLVLPAGWRLAAAVDRTSGGAPTLPDANGRFQREGGGYFFYVVTPPGVVDPGPDLRVRGGDVVREANASVTAAGVAVAIDHAYDTGHYGAQWKAHVPPNATDVRVFTPQGRVAFQRSTPEEIGFELPYPPYGLGGRNFTVAYVLPPPEAVAGPFREFDLHVSAGTNDTVTTRVHLPAGATFTGANTGNAAQVEPEVWRSRGPSVVTVRYLPEVAPGHARFTEGAFVVDVPRALEDEARLVARNASELLAGAVAFLPPTDAARPFFVAYTDAAVFDWEQGFYAPGVNTISIRARDLQNVTGEAEVDAVSTLLHETAHAVYDRAMPQVGENLSFIKEGLSRLAEIHVEDAFPDQVPRCNAEQTSCQPGARLTAASLQKFHQDGKTFDASWVASRTPGEERGFLYSYSGLVFHAFQTRAPPGALPAALLNLSRTPAAATDEAEAERIIATLLAYAPGTTREALLYPGREAAHLDAEHFRSCMGDLVAPPYPWERDGLTGGKLCPANGYGGSTATLPPPPPEKEPTPPPPPPTIVVEPSPTPPVFVTPDDAPLPTPAGLGSTETPTRSGEAPGGVVVGGTPPAPIPGPSPALALALALAVALVLRRRA